MSYKGFNFSVVRRIDMPSECYLHHNYPNPFNPPTIIMLQRFLLLAPGTSYRFMNMGIQDVLVQQIDYIIGGKLVNKG